MSLGDAHACTHCDPAAVMMSRFWRRAKDTRLAATGKQGTLYCLCAYTSTFAAKMSASQLDAKDGLCTAQEDCDYFKLGMLAIMALCPEDCLLWIWARVAALQHERRQAGTIA